MIWTKILDEVSKGHNVGEIHLGEALMPSMDACIDHQLKIEAILLERDINGGECMNCGKEYKRIEVKTKYIHFSYFEPACSCFPRCPLCGRMMHHEVLTNQNGCRNCGASQCIEEGKTNDYDENAKRRVEKHIRCSGVATPMSGGNFRCTDCGAVHSSNEIYDYLSKSLRNGRRPIQSGRLGGKA